MLYPEGRCCGERALTVVSIKGAELRCRLSSSRDPNPLRRHAKQTGCCLNIRILQAIAHPTGTHFDKGGASEVRGCAQKRADATSARGEVRHSNTDSTAVASLRSSDNTAYKIFATHCQCVLLNFY